MEISNNLRIRELRKETTSYTQESLAERLGISPKTYAGYENGNTAIPTEILKKLAKEFNVSIDFMLGNSDYTNIDNEYMAAALGLSDKSINALKRYKKADSEAYNETVSAIKKHRRKINLPRFITPFIDFLLSSSSFPKFTERFFNMCSDRYQIPIYDNGDSLELFPSYTEKEKDFLYFGCNPDNPADNISVQIDSDFRKAINKNLLELSLSDLVQEYKKSSRQQTSKK